MSEFDPNTNFADVFAESLTPGLRDEFALLGETVGMEQVWEFVLRSHVRILKPTMFVRLADKALISDKAFTSQFARVVNGIVALPRQYRDNPVKYAIGTNVPLASAPVYEPGKGDWPTPTTFNMYRPAGYGELAERPELFLRHIRYLIPDQLERDLFLAFLKYAVQNPDKKMTFALLIVGRRGTGKSWLSKFFKALFGAHNVLVIERGQNVTAKFNADEQNKQLIFVDELVPDGKSNEVTKALVPKIVGEDVTIEMKGVDKFTVPNRYNIVTISNYETAIHIEGRQDRKWLVVRSTPRIWGTDENGQPTIETTEYYDQLHEWVKVGDSPDQVSDEIRRCLWWLRTSPIRTKDFNGQGIAPMTPTKEDVAALTETTLETTISGAYVDAAGPFRFELFSVEDVRVAYAEDDGRTAQAISGDVSAIIEDIGCRRVGSKQVYVGGRKPRRLWCRNERLLPKYINMTAKELADAYKSERKGRKPDPVAAGAAAFDDGDDTIDDTIETIQARMRARLAQDAKDFGP